MNLIPLLSTVISFAFTVAVFQRYLVRKGPHLLMWSIGLLLYGLGTLSEVLLSLAFDPFVLKLWYLCGAMLTAAWLGMGTIHLLVRRGRIAWGITAGLGVLSVAGMILVFGAPLTAAVDAYRPAVAVSAQYKDILVRGGAVTALTIILNIFGTLGMVGGAIYSAYLFWRKQVLLNRVIGNVLIAAGALSPAMAGSFVKAGLVDILYVSELIGAVLMFLGFWLATSKATIAVPAQSVSVKQS
jgi:hypothetical protein